MESRSFLIFEGSGYAKEELRLRKKSFETKDHPKQYSMSPNSVHSDQVYVTQRDLKCTCTLAVQIE
jgi:hypothetical protein